MLFRLIADALVLVHFAFILFVCLGAVLVIRRPRWIWLHLPAVLWGAAIEFLGWVCPLTPLEWHLRHLAGEAGHDGGFIEYYLIRLIYPPGLTTTVQWTLGSIVVVVNMIFYWMAWRHYANRSER